MTTKSTKKSKVWISNAIFVVYCHIMAFMAFLLVKPRKELLSLSLAIWFLSKVGVTMGYHRLWSHRTYEAALPLQILLAILGTMGVQGSIKWWSERHRLHHRFTDTKDDPYNAKKGFWFSHMGWIFQRQYYPKLSCVDLKDLTDDPCNYFCSYIILVF